MNLNKDTVLNPSLDQLQIEKLDIFQTKGPLHVDKEDNSIHSFKLVSLSKTLIQLDIYTRR